MKITVKMALEMAQAVTQLDGYQNGTPMLTPYKYDAATRLAIAVARRKLRAVVEDYQNARNAALLEATGGTGELPPVNDRTPADERRRIIAQSIAFDKMDKELLAAEIEIGIAPIPSAKFNLDNNPIPPAVLDMLGEFIALEG